MTFEQTPIKDTNGLLDYGDVIMRTECTISASSQSVHSSIKIHTGDIEPSVNICSFLCTNCVTLYFIHMICQITVHLILSTVQYSVRPPRFLPQRVWGPSFARWKWLSSHNAFFHACPQFCQNQPVHNTSPNLRLTENLSSNMLLHFVGGGYWVVTSS